MAENVIVRSPNHLGDCIMALPMINETREVHPGARVTVLTPEYLADLFRDNPAVDNIITLPSDSVHGLMAVIKIKEKLASGKFEIGYILPPSFGAAAGFKLGGVGKRIGYISDGRRLLLSKPLPLPEPLGSEHRSRLYFNLLLRGTGAQLEFVPPRIFLNDDDMSAAATLLKRFGLSRDEEYAAVAVQAVAESRRWPLDKFIELVKLMAARYNLKILLLGGAAEQSASEKVSTTAGAGGIINLAGKTSLRESAAILSGARFFVSNDSGPAHLAAAVGTPLVVLSGADEPSSTSPITDNKRVVRLDHLDCISCVKNKCPLKGDDHMRCMNGISVTMVAEAVSDLVG